MQGQNKHKSSLLIVIAKQIFIVQTDFVNVTMSKIKATRNVYWISNVLD